MQINYNFSILPLLMGVFLLFISGCEKEDNNPLNGKTTAVFNPSLTYGTMTDQDGNVYRTVTIGAQTWMAENLRTTKYNDGTAIPHVIKDDEWISLATGAYCNYHNTSNIDTIATYGRLYNWHSVNTGKLAPKGWRVPTDSDWTKLTNHLGGERGAAGKLKETGTTHWNSPNTGATNETGFTALPGGIRGYTGTFGSIGSYGGWWSATEDDSNVAWTRNVRYNVSQVSRHGNNKELGFSVRCIKD